MFRGSPTLPLLRSLDLVRIAGQILNMQPRPTLHVPALERLTIDLTYDHNPGGQLANITRIMDCVGRAQPLSNLTIRLPAAFNTNSPALAQVCAELAPAAHQVRIEYSPAARQHDYPCYWHKSAAQ
ncbi:hypothetical protein AURDEDRAFT_175976 [Auricularia subglabra TFB-10046 SS5]|nr:hypothetical protein AURDEDRAFT_175976 [Auricularia subglabra TFB-10046 SS5]